MDNIEDEGRLSPFGEMPLVFVIKNKETKNKNTNHTIKMKCFFPKPILISQNHIVHYLRLPSGVWKAHFLGRKGEVGGDYFTFETESLVLSTSSLSGSEQGALK